MRTEGRAPVGRQSGRAWTRCGRTPAAPSRQRAARKHTCELGFHCIEHNFQWRTSANIKAVEHNILLSRFCTAGCSPQQCCRDAATATCAVRWTQKTSGANNEDCSQLPRPFAANTCCGTSTQRPPDMPHLDCSKRGGGGRQAGHRGGNDRVAQDASQPLVASSAILLKRELRQKEVLV